MVVYVEIEGESGEILLDTKFAGIGPAIDYLARHQADYPDDEVEF